MEIARPQWLLVALVSVPVVVAAYVLAERARRRALGRMVSAHQARRLASVEGTALRWCRIALGALGIALALVAIARPRFGTKLEVVSRKGLDVIVALDTSLSMLTEDVPPNRLEMAKRTVSDLIDRLAGDRIGLVAFAGDAYVACPLTLDKGAAKMFLGDVGPFSVAEAGSSVGTAIRKAVAAFGRKEQKYKVILLLTDGEDHRTDPLGAAREARDAGVVVYAMGFGTAAGAPIPLKEDGALSEYKKDRKGEVVVSRLDESTLGEVASITGGRYFRATPAQREIEGLFDELERMEKTELSQKLYALKEERFQIPLLAGLALLFGEAFLRVAGRRRRAVVAALVLAALAVAPDAAAGPLPLTGAAPDVEEGNRLYREGKYEEALSAYARARAEAPDAPEIPYDVGNVMYQQKKYDEALREYGQAAGGPGGPALPAALYNQGNAHFRAGRLDEAMKSFAEAIRRDPSDADAKWNYELARRRIEEQKKQQEQEQEKQDPEKDQKDQEKDEQPKEGRDGGGSKDDGEQGKEGQEDAKEPSPEAGEDEKGGKREEPQEQDRAEGQKPGNEEDGKSPQESRSGTEGEASEGSGEPGKEGQAAAGQLSREDAERVLDAFLQLEKDAKAQAEKKRRMARQRSAAEDW